MTEAPFGPIAGLLEIAALVIVAVTVMRTSLTPQQRNDWLIVAVVGAVIAAVLRIVQLVGR